MFDVVYFLAPCSELMPEEGQSPVQRKTEDGPLNPGEPWTPAAGETEELIVEFPAPAEVSSIRLTDDKAPLSFRVAYQPEEGADFVDYKDDNGEPQVKMIVKLIVNVTIY